MNVNVNSATTDVARPTWRDPAAWARTADVMAILTAAAMPWSTSLVAIFFVVFIVVLIPSGNPREFFQSLRRPVNLVPIIFFLLAVIGTLWAADISWKARLHGINPVAKLLAIPFLVYHFERSHRGMWVFVTFLVSCFLLMIMSWVVAFVPALSIKQGSYGVPVKNYIDQSQEFALCAFALAWPVLNLIRRRSYARAVLLVAVALSFIVNMIFVNVARTAFVYMPVMLLAFAILHLKVRDIVLLGVACAIAIGAAWAASPNLRNKVGTIFTEYGKYDDPSKITSVGQRLEYWTKSIKFAREAPVIGNGTGSTKALFVQDAIGQSGLAAEVIGNPHNQTLNVAVQWGAIGVIILYAMWIVHAAQFLGPGLVPWLGILVVVQNVTSSLFNSHLFDFHEGWMYVLGVGIAAGMVAKQRRNGAIR
jgi:O-antigen ligase